MARDLAEGSVPAVVPLVIETSRAVKANIALDAGLLSAIDEAATKRGLMLRHRLRMPPGPSGAARDASALAAGIDNAASGG